MNSISAELAGGSPSVVSSGTIHNLPSYKECRAKELWMQPARVRSKKLSVDLGSYLGGSKGDRRVEAPGTWAHWSDADSMKRGAVVLMDALGFRGIWNRGHSVTGILHKMAGLQRAAKKREKREAHVAIAFLSDTVVIAVADVAHDVYDVDSGETTPAHPDARDAVFDAAVAASEILGEALEQEPRLAYRGCMSFGAFHVEPPFVLGPAVDEAASAHEAAEGALVWLMPSALEVVRDTELTSETFLLRHVVPLKGGAVFHTAVVSPFDPTDLDPERRFDADRLLATFDLEGARNDLTVQMKRQNTAAFLERAIEQK